MKMKTIHARRKRRQQKAAQRFGAAAKSSHRLVSGRTGSVQYKRRKSMRG